MIPYANPTTLDQESPSAPSNQRPDLHQIAEELHMKREELSSHIQLGAACCQAVYEEIRDCSKRVHLKAWRAKIGERVQSKAVRKLKRRLGRQPVFHRVFDWGVLMLEDSSCQTEGEFYWGAKLRIVLNAVLENPMLADTFVAHGQCHSLVMALQNLLERTIADPYSGPGTVHVDEGDDYWESVNIEIFGDTNEALDSSRVAEELARLLDDEFNRRIGELAFAAEYIYVQIGRP